MYSPPMLLRCRMASKSIFARGITSSHTWSTVVGLLDALSCTGLGLGDGGGVMLRTCWKLALLAVTSKPYTDDTVLRRPPSRDAVDDSRVLLASMACAAMDSARRASSEVDREADGRSATCSFRKMPSILRSAMDLRLRCSQWDARLCLGDGVLFRLGSGELLADFVLRGVDVLMLIRGSQSMASDFTQLSIADVLLNRLS